MNDIKAYGAEVMQVYGWERVANFNYNKRMPAVFVDQVWLQKDRKLWAFIEEKYGEDRLSEAQERLWCTFLAYSGPQMFYAIVSSCEDWERVALAGRSVA